MPDLAPNIVGGLTEALVGGLVALFVAYFAYALQNRGRQLEYSVFAMPFLHFDPAGTPIQVAVSKTVVTGNEADEGAFIPVSNAYGFRVTAWNVGNDPIENCTIEVQLDRQAKIVGCWTEPVARPAFPIQIIGDTTNPSALTVWIPHINQGNKVNIRFISVDNASGCCSVDVIAKGTKVRETRPVLSTTNIVRTSLPIAWPSVAMIVISLARSLILEPILVGLGYAQVIQTQRTVWPWWLEAITGGLYLGLGGLMVFLMIRAGKLLNELYKW